MKIVLKSYFLLLIFIPMFLTLVSAQETLLSRADSMKNMICAIGETDQLIRSKPWNDAMQAALKKNDKTNVDSIDKAFKHQDSINFTLLKNLIINDGYPQRTKNADKCVRKLTGVMIHWSKEHPDEFNSPEMVAVFKREVDRRHLSRYTLDMAIYFYISYMYADTQYMELINNARMAYGLPLYTMDEYLGKTRVEFDLQKLNADELSLTKQ